MQLYSSTTDNMKKIPRVYWVISLFLSVLVLFFAPIFFHGEIIFTDILLKYAPYTYLKPQSYIYDNDLRSDMLDGYYPKEKILVEDKKSLFTFSTWDDNSQFGEPRDTLIGGYDFYLSYLNGILSVDQYLTWFTVVKMFLGLLGMYFLLSELKLTNLAKVLGSIVFVFSSFNIVWIWGHAVTVSMILPWFTFALIKVLNKHYRYAVLIIFLTYLALSTGFVAGAGYMLYFGMIFVVLYFIYEKFKPLLYRGHGKTSYKDILESNIKYIYILVAVVVGILLILYALIPALEYLKFIDIGYRQDLNAKEFLPISKVLPQLFMPFYYGGFFGHGYEGIKNYNETSLYIGIIPLVLYFFGVVFTLIRRKIFELIFLLTSIFAFCIIFNLGGILDFVNKLPILNSSSSTRLIMIFVFASSIIAAVGFDSIFDYIRNLSRIKLKRIFLFSYSSAILLFLYTINVNRNVIISLVFTKQIDWSKIQVLMILIYFAYVLVVLFLIIIHKRIRDLINIRILIVLLIVAELFLYSYKYIPMVPKSWLYPKSEGISYLIENTDSDDRVLPIGAVFGTPGTAKYYNLNIPLDHMLYSEPEKKYLESLFIDKKRMWASRTNPLLLADNINFDSSKIDELNVKYLVFNPAQNFPKDIQDKLEENFSLVKEIKDLKIYENRTGYSLEHVANGSLSLSSKDISSERNVYDLVNSEETTFYTTQRYSPNWKVKVNHESADVRVYDSIWRGVRLMPGKNHVEFYYESPRIYTALKPLSLIVVTMSLMLYLFYEMRRIYRSSKQSK